MWSGVSVLFGYDHLIARMHARLGLKRKVYLVYALIKLVVSIKCSPRDDGVWMPIAELGNGIVL